jgi:diglucosylglycerate octanoyltransferase
VSRVPQRFVLVFGDSLTFHGPERPERLDDPRLYPNVMAAALGDDVEADVVARLGWTARDAWWAATKDPRVWTHCIPRADALVLGVGQMDHLPAALPTYLREGIAYVRPGALRRRVRRAYQVASPHVIRATGGRVRQLPQAATDQYLSRLVQAVRHYRPGIPIALLGPSPHAAGAYPPHRHHTPAVAAGRRWAQREGVGFVDLDPIVQPGIDSGEGNPDGMHWSWAAHRGVGEGVAAALRDQGWAG